MRIKTNYTNTPNWIEVYSHSNLPEQLKPLAEIADNLWWVWNYEATSLFNRIDKDLWKNTCGNPHLLLQKLSFSRMEEICEDAELMAEVATVYKKFKKYKDVAPDANKPSVAYFSMEYGLTNILKIYSGGLGVLAGDYLKEASDCNIDMTAVGFLYRYGYFTQTLAVDGQQIANYEPQDFAQLPITQLIDEQGQPFVLEVPFPAHTVYAHVWEVKVGRISLYLMDTDFDANSEWDKSITHQLYGGDFENRMKQEYLLGIGGILLLNKLGIKKQVYHCNEGHAALINAQRLADYIADENLTFNQAKEVVKASSLYTVHTPVPAGHDYFDEGLFGKYMGQFPEKLGITWEEFMDMGRENPGSNEKFSMSVFALNTCQEANGVSYLHGIVSQHMFAPVWKGYFPEELHVGYVTNGVHMPTWAATEFKKFYLEHFGEEFFLDQSNKSRWEDILQVPDEDIWQLRKTLKRRLIDYIKAQYSEDWLRTQSSPASAMSVIDKINPNALLIGFGRRFATYKRAHLLFTDLERLAKIVNNEKYPVQFIFTGKAHPADGGGQGLIKRIVEISKRPEFLGKIIFLENYDMRLARRLISGVDVWLNTPTRPLEASGTSGEKAEMNGVLNFSVLDGWWYEGYKEGAGWALTDKRTYDNQEYQDQLDASTIYYTLENKIIPLYFAQNSKGYSPEWVQYIKNSICQIAPDYTTKRMLDDYILKFYRPLAKRSAKLSINHFAKAKEIALWKENVAAHWDSFQVVSITWDHQLEKRGVQVGSPYKIEVVLDKKDLEGDLGIDLVITTYDNIKKEQRLKRTEEFKVVKQEGTLVYYEVETSPDKSGLYKLGLRVYPKNPDLPNRMDFAYTRWIG